MTDLTRDELNQIYKDVTPLIIHTCDGSQQKSVMNYMRHIGIKTGSKDITQIMQTIYSDYLSKKGNFCPNFNTYLNDKISKFLNEKKAV